MVNWRDYIVSDKAILGGKPTIKGTRLSAAFILERLASGWSEKEVLENYPSLTQIHLQAVFAYALTWVEDGLLSTPMAKRA